MKLTSGVGRGTWVESTSDMNMDSYPVRQTAMGTSNNECSVGSGYLPEIEQKASQCSSNKKFWGHNVPFLCWDQRKKSCGQECSTVSPMRGLSEALTPEKSERTKFYYQTADHWKPFWRSFQVPRVSCLAACLCQHQQKKRHLVLRSVLLPLLAADLSATVSPPDCTCGPDSHSKKQPDARPSWQNTTVRNMSKIPTSSFPFLLFSFCKLDCARTRSWCVLTSCTRHPKVTSARQRKTNRHGRSFDKNFPTKRDDTKHNLLFPLLRQF